MVPNHRCFSEHWKNPYAMNITNFNELLAVARAQPIPQRLLFLFARAELPAEASAEQRRDFEAGQGGYLAPLMSVDKTPDALTSFISFAAEADQISADWEIVFVGALQSSNGHHIDAAMVDDALNRMTEAIHLDQTDGLIPFNRLGEAVVLK